MEESPHPDFGAAIIDDRKLADYLLSPEHPVGREKSRFFRGLGFRPDRLADLREALRRHALAGAIVAREETAFGAKYVIDGPLAAPNGRNAPVRVVWFVERDGVVVRFVTAYPSPGGRVR